MEVHLVGGFLGSGKTTAIQHAAALLHADGVITGVISNDQGSRLVDGDMFRNLGLPTREVVNGCFCCNYHELDTGIMSLAKEEKAEIIFAESVGSCTDLVATVLKPLQHFRGGIQVTISIFADARLLDMLLHPAEAGFDENIRYIYTKQLEEAGIIVINKIDLCNAPQLAALKKKMEELYGGKTLLFQNSLEQKDIRAWLETLRAGNADNTPASIDIDYDKYADGEERLGWLDDELTITSSSGNALQDAAELANLIYSRISREGYPIGHLKFLLNGSFKISFSAGGESPVAAPLSKSPGAHMLVNMRVQVAPEVLSAVVDAAIAETEQKTGCRITSGTRAAFQPAYPRPTFRM